jgi:WD40 repeat protein/tetratricopeptide (TPR) repeat protein
VIVPRFVSGDQFLLTMTGNRMGHYTLEWRYALNGKPLANSTSPDFRDLAVFQVSDDGLYVAALGEEKARLWDARTRQLLSDFRTPPASGWPNQVLFSVDGAALLTCATDTRVRSWSLESRSGRVFTTAIPPIIHPQQPVRIDLSHDGEHLAAALWDGTVCLWRRPAGVPSSYSVAVSGATLPALSADKRFVAPRGISYREGTQRETRVYEAATGEAAGQVLDAGGILLDATFSPDGTHVATASLASSTPAERRQRHFRHEAQGGTVRIWDWQTGKTVAGPIPTPGEPRGLAYRPDGRTLAVVCSDYHVLLVDPNAGSITYDLDPGHHVPMSWDANQLFSNGEARFSPDGRYLVTWETTTHVDVWDPDRGQHLHTLPHTERLRYVCFNPAAPELLATSGFGNEARVWDLATGKLVVTLRHPRWVGRLQFTPDGEELITGADDGLLRVWDWKANKVIEGWPLHPTSIEDFSVVAPRHALVTLTSDALQVADWRTKTPLSPLWNLKPDFNLALKMELPSGDGQVIVGGFLRTLMGYDLETILAPTAAPAEDLVRLAEVAAARRISSQGTVVPLSSVEWGERYRQLRPTPDELRQREAQGLVASLFERLVRKSAVLRQLRQDPHLAADLRAEAVTRAERHAVIPHDLNNQSWGVVRTQGAPAVQYARALLQAEEACALRPENGAYLNTLGVAQYRMGSYQQAIETLTRSDQRNRGAGGKSRPGDLAFLSLAQQRLGLKQEARTTFERLRERMDAPDQARTPSPEEEGSPLSENYAFLREAGLLIVGTEWPVIEERHRAKRERRLQALLDGKEMPSDVNELMANALLAAVRDRRYAGAAHLVERALQAQPGWADRRPEDPPCYLGAQCAALAAAGSGSAVERVSEAESRQLRQLAVTWLRAELPRQTTRAKGGPQVRDAVRRLLRSWKEVTSLASIRDEALLRKLPADEQALCKKLWAEVDALLAKLG